MKEMACDRSIRYLNNVPLTGLIARSIRILRGVGIYSGALECFTSRRKINIPNPSASVKDRNIGEGLFFAR